VIDRAADGCGDQRDESETVGIRQITTRSGPWSMSALRQAERLRPYGIP
jgi:hypothetical protein